jgi:curved DNA-binding protein CbpA
MSGQDREAFWARVMALNESLDRMSYYHLLGVELTASTKEIQAAYYRRIRGIHPDRHAYERDPVRKRALVRLNARFGEAVRVLKSTALRTVYDQELSRGQARLTADAQRAREAELAGPDPRTPQGRMLLEAGQALVRGGDAAAGLAKLEMAAQFEPDSNAIRQAVEGARQAAVG